MTSESGVEASGTRRLVPLFSSLALAVGLPVLAMFALRQFVSASKIAEISELAGHRWSAREYLLAFLVSPALVPAVWCAAAAYGALLNAPRAFRRAAAVVLGLTLLWAVALAVLLATA